MNKLFIIDRKDNVAVALEALKKGYTEQGISLIDDVPCAHKVALCDMKEGDTVIKYGCPIGHLTRDVRAGEHIHEHNLKTNLSGELEYSFCGDTTYKAEKPSLTFNGYLREDGRAGTRNEIWIISTVGCVNKTVELLAENAGKKSYPDCDGVFGYTHPFGCSQMGDDQENTRKIIASLVNHPNAGGVLVVSLGCENSNAEIIKSYIADYDENRVKFLVTQDCEDELEEGARLIDELYEYASKADRTELPISLLSVGLKCGGSDAFSGITANPLCGVVTDKLTAQGSGFILSEVPEMFGAETLLFERSENRTVFDKAVGLINGYKSYFASHGQECYENPSPGNHEGGITTLEEKSLGCIKKGGNAVITDVLGYGDAVSKAGLSLLSGPGNDIVAITNLTAAGATLILFTTGRGTPLGAPVPTVKISSNTALSEKKSGWIDFDAGAVIGGADIDSLGDELISLIIDIASGKNTKNELGGYRQISIFKDGVIM